MKKMGRKSNKEKQREQAIKSERDIKKEREKYRMCETEYVRE